MNLTEKSRAVMNTLFDLDMHSILLSETKFAQYMQSTEGMPSPHTFKLQENILDMFCGLNIPVETESEIEEKLANSLKINIKSEISSNFVPVSLQKKITKRRSESANSTKFFNLLTAHI